MDYRDNQIRPYPSDRCGINPGKAMAGNAVMASDSPSIIRDAVTTLEEQVKCLYEYVGRLQSRLEAVLQPVPPMPVDPNTAGLSPNVGGSHLHIRLAALGEDLGGLITRVNDLTRRVEI